jgi:hypothetical protein
MPNKVKNDSRIDSHKSREAVNIHLSIEVVDNIEEALFHFRKTLPRETRKKLNRSVLYMLILEDVLREFKTAGNEARLNKIISNWSQKIID